ncbi:60S ribosomal protein L31 [Cymbomonas tetramitiformis]|uniref:60S ribosomal protein L31 n=1 Tax=Cymbomonas tetramitiformis TaxID=36881 RepID=A0AAE0GP86_9CHLO|nr:60S ribosomal protein L31 [Cymbomonas tetramitiformis]KAK3246791.1 60S ribosomal protein L31 [Cymbomonas tetramitiformis]KAK3281513.1 60S ribosomal protein L31 [Cymbomonas tetramitiformis]|eukprot:gene19912-23823_t
MAPPQKSRTKDVVSREYTLNLHKMLHKINFKKRAPRAVSEVKKFAAKVMKTEDVRIDVKLNKHIWSKGIRNVPNRIRVKVSRKRNDDEDAKEELYSYVTVADIPKGIFSGVGTKVVED